MRAGNHLFLIFFGMALTFGGVYMWTEIQSGQLNILSGFLILIGNLFCFLGLSSFGDQKVQRPPRANPEQNKTHIPSIEVGSAHVPNFDERKLEEAKNLIRQGQIVPAIEIYRQTTGHGLLEASRWVRKVAAEIAEE